MNQTMSVEGLLWFISNRALIAECPTTATSPSTPARLDLDNAVCDKVTI